MLKVGNCQDVTDLNWLCAGEDRKNGDEKEPIGEEEREDTIHWEQETEVENDNQDDVGKGDLEHTDNQEKYQEIIINDKENKKFLREIVFMMTTLPHIKTMTKILITKKELFLSAKNTYSTNNHSKIMKSYSTKLKYLIVLVCFSHREHSWTSTAPKWKLSGRKYIIKKKVDYLKHIDVSNNSLIEEELSKFKYVTSWKLPQFKVHHVRLL